MTADYGRFRAWCLAWWNTLTLPRHIKRELREPIPNPDGGVVERPELNDGCEVTMTSSRMCERGTKGCDVRHNDGSGSASDG